MNKTISAVCFAIALLLSEAAPAASPIPGRIQAEDFSSSFDTDSGNNGGFYRSTDVDIDRDNADGAYYVGWTRAGEWLDFLVDISTSGQYVVTARVASEGQGGAFYFLFDTTSGQIRTNDIVVPDTGGWRNWQLVTASVSLPAGTQVMRIAFDSQGPSGSIGNIDWVQFIPQGASTPVCICGPIQLPGKIQAEDFDLGGEGIAYHDSDEGNNGGMWRDTDVDLDVDQGNNVDFTSAVYVGWTRAGEWLAYTVDVAKSGYYNVSMRVASEGPGGTLSAFGDVFTIPDTGGWRNWTVISTPRPVFLSSGRKVVRIELREIGASGSVGNIDWVEVSEPNSLQAFSGSPAAIPGTINPVSFDFGGEGVAYHDLDGPSAGCNVRFSDVEACAGALHRFFVAMRASEWLKYTVNVQTEGFYTIKLRSSAGGVFHVEFDGVDQTGPIQALNTGGEVTLQGVHLTAGTQVMRVSLDDASPSDRVVTFDALQFVKE